MTKNRYLCLRTCVTYVSSPYTGEGRGEEIKINFYTLIPTFFLKGDGTDFLSVAALPPSLEGEGDF